MTALLIATIILVLVNIIIAIWKISLESLTRRRCWVIYTRLIGTIFVLLVVTYLLLNLRDIQAHYWVLISLYAGLVAVTVVYALSTHRQANASINMAEEMRKQRRPIVVPKAFPAIGVPLEATAEEIAEHRYSDYFQIYNKGNSPAINLEVLLLNHEESQFDCLKETVFSQGDKPLVFPPSGLVNYLQSTCYLVCRYCSVLSTEERQIWYETWLPFIPNKSQRGDQIIIVPKELGFREEFEKKSY